MGGGNHTFEYTKVHKRAQFMDLVIVLTIIVLFLDSFVNMNSKIGFKLIDDLSNTILT